MLPRVSSPKGTVVRTVFYNRNLLKILKASRYRGRYRGRLHSVVDLCDPGHVDGIFVHLVALSHTCQDYNFFKTGERLRCF